MLFNNEKLAATSVSADNVSSDDGNLRSHYGSLIEWIGEDLSREGLARTPERAARAFLDLTSGYQTAAKAIINGAIFSDYGDAMVVVKGVEFYSLCEHHLLPFWGTCDVGYVPDGKIIGLSKIGRIVDMFSRRLQVQERLGAEISQCLVEHLEPKGVCVVVNAQHLCMMMRGVQKQKTSTSTRHIQGCFVDNSALQRDFFNLAKC